VEDQRRVVSLSGKHDTVLPSNRLNAEKRLQNFTKRLDNIEALKMYHDQMLNYITRGQVEGAPVEEPTSTVFCLPHQAVRKEKHGNIKWGIVFSCFSHETNEPSLNDVLEMGPNHSPGIFVFLLRFRLHHTAIISDSSGTELRGIVKDTTVRRMRLWLTGSPDYYLASPVAILTVCNTEGSR